MARNWSWLRRGGALGGEEGGGGGCCGGDGGEEQTGGVQRWGGAAAVGLGGVEGGNEPDSQCAGDALPDVEQAVGVGELGGWHGAGDGIQQRGDNQADRRGATGQDGCGEGQ